MATLAHLIPKIFKHAWRRYGKPVMWVVRPPAAWSLPAGFAYDGGLDAITDTATGSLTLTNPEDYWAGDMVYIVPVGRTADLGVLVAAGVVPEGTVEVYILPADALTVRRAHAVEIAGDWYDVVEVAQGPAGQATSGQWCRVRLRRRA